MTLSPAADSAWTRIAQLVGAVRVLGLLGMSEPYHFHEGMTYVIVCFGAKGDADYSVCGCKIFGEVDFPELGLGDSERVYVALSFTGTLGAGALVEVPDIMNLTTT